MITTWSATTGDWDDSKFDRGWDGPNISPAKGDLTLSTVVPSIKEAINISPGVATFELVQSYEWDQLTSSWVDTAGTWDSGPVPSVAIGEDDAPAKADLTLSASIPSVGIQYKFPIAIGELTATGSIPKVGEALHITPAVANIEFIKSYEWDQLTTAWIDTANSWETGPSPSVAVGSGISPAKGDLTLSGSIPTLKYYYNLIVGNESLALTGSIPEWNFGKEFDIDAGGLEIVQTWTWDNYGGTWANASTTWSFVPFIPDAIEAGQNQPDSATLTINAQTPKFTKQQLWYVPTADLTLSTVAPDAPIGPIFEPETAAELKIIQTYDWNNYGGTWNNASNNWDNADFIPTAVETGQNQPDAATLTLSGQLPVASEDYRESPGKGDLTFTKYSPHLGISHQRTIPATQLTGLGTTSWEDTSGDWASSSDVWGTGTLAPTCGITYIFPMKSADGFELTAFDPEWPLVGQPKYIPDIILS